MPSWRTEFRAATSSCSKARSAPARRRSASSSSIGAPVEFDEPGIIVLFEVSPDRLVRDAAELGWDLPALERARKLKIIFTTRQVFAQELQQADSLLLEEAAAMGARRIFVDGVAGVSSVSPGAARVRTRGTRFTSSPRGCSARISPRSSRWRRRRSASSRALALPEESIADTVIRLRMEEVTRATVRSLEIVKSRGHDFQMGRHSFRIVDGRGIEVYRRVQAPRGRAATRPRPSIRRRASPPVCPASTRW